MAYVLIEQWSCVGLTSERVGDSAGDDPNDSTHERTKKRVDEESLLAKRRKDVRAFPDRSDRECTAPHSCT